ncbi:MAG TPA: transglutaminase-like domain-containing protein [Candidatus Sulfotelmatobacter sp.]|nr:transglutaminase-like domain-containing protein [Candidatus Sulfotelmatobacter sp.]
MIPTDPIRQDFIRSVERPEPAMDLARTALIVAAESDPNVDVDGVLHTLDSWADELRRRLDPDWNNLQKLARLRAYLFEELGFAGERRDYYNPNNSLLHQVMKSRRGIPLTLAIVFMELGWRLGIPFEGVGFPGHFMVRLTGEPGDLILDPFEHGCSVHEEDLRRILQEVGGGALEFHEDLVASVGKRDIIRRLLNNLKGAYLRAGDDQHALAAVERLLLMLPGDAHETRDAGLLLYRLQRYGQALEKLEAYLATKPDPTDIDSVRAHVKELRQKLAEMN